MTTALATPPSTTPSARRTPPIKAAAPLSWVNTLFIGSAHLAAVYAVVHMAVFDFSWWTIGLGLVWYAFCGFSITGGYHRLFSHKSHTAHWSVRLFHLLFGAASVQNSALKWSTDHRRHHAETDTEDDPYSVKRGFWWAHMGWVLHRDPQEHTVNVKDLERDPLVRFQDRFYVPLAILMAAVVPAAIGTAWGDPLGALLVVGFLRLVVQWHATFSINSLAHMIGARPYDPNSTARDSWVTALVSFGEGYHNFHHRFQADYRNGIRWYHFDPTKWAIRSMSWVGLTKDLRRTPVEAIERARREARAATGASS
jgi:stearoyl-CoA desaturase (delta-9 desaturase)